MARIYIKGGLFARWGDEIERLIVDLIANAAIT